MGGGPGLDFSSLQLNGWGFLLAPPSSVFVCTPTVSLFNPPPCVVCSLLQKVRVLNFMQKRLPAYWTHMPAATLVSIWARTFAFLRARPAAHATHSSLAPPCYLLAVVDPQAVTYSTRDTHNTRMLWSLQVVTHNTRGIT